MKEKKQSPMLWRLLKNMFFLALMSVLLLVIFINVKSLIRKTEPSFFQYRFYTVSDETMAPTLHKGDLILVSDTGLPQLQNGNLLVVKDPDNGKAIVRLNEIVENNQSMKVSLDSIRDQGPITIPMDRLNGKILYYIPSFGNVVEKIFSPVGLAILALIFIGMCYSYWNRRKRRKQRKLLRQSQAINRNQSNP